MSEAKKDYTWLTSGIGGFLAFGTAIGVFLFFETMDATFLAFLAAGVVLVFVTFGLNYILQHLGGLGGFALAIMSATSFGVAVVQAYIWCRAWPL